MNVRFILSHADSNNKEVTDRNLFCLDVAYAVKPSCSRHRPNASIGPVSLHIAEWDVKYHSLEGNGTSAICTVLGDAFLVIFTQPPGAGDDGWSSFDGIRSTAFHNTTLSVTGSLVMSCAREIVANVVFKVTFCVAGVRY